MKLFPFRDQLRHGLPAQPCQPARRSILLKFLFLLVAFVVATPLHAGPHRLPGFGDPSYDQPYDPQPDYWHEWGSMAALTDSLLKSIGATNAEAALLLRQVQTNSMFLHAKWNAWFDTHARSKNYSPTDSYLDSLRADNRQLGRAKKEKDAAQTLAMVRDVAFDLQIKADNCRNSGDGLGKEIRVKVHTKADGKEIGGYEVFYVSKGMFDVKSAHDRFPRQSSPTDEKILCPGGYKLWVRKDKFTSEPVAMGIGGHGETHLEVDISVPSE